MSELKDKLSTSVQQAKGTLRSKTENSAPEAPSVAKSTSSAKPTPSKPAAGKPAVKSATKPGSGTTSANDIQASHNTLFPERVWPD
ncbi:hypothetical protein [Nitrosomonas sp. ANs5]|uniref:hypothetical protein n=1 Tax=Nitrosomonas sp. ANs5 TaxID=3423941 RepID=UPI003D33FE3D